MATAVMFSGQGAQKVGMGRSLYEGSETARSLYDTADRVLGWPLTRISFEGPVEALTLTRVCQPALFVHGFALFRLLEEAGKTAEVAIALGLSLGEVTALTVAGAFDFETGLRVVARRAELMQAACEQTRGAMASILGEETGTVEALCREFDIEIANFNCPGKIVVSGEEGRVGRAIEAARARGMRRVISLKVAGAYHSRLMQPARQAFAAFLASVPVAPPRLTVLTNTTGRAVGDPAAIREALERQIVSPVRWEACVREAVALGASRLLELGPGGVLSGLVRRTDKAWPVTSIAEMAEVAA